MIRWLVLALVVLGGAWAIQLTVFTDGADTYDAMTITSYPSVHVVEIPQYHCVDEAEIVLTGVPTDLGDTFVVPVDIVVLTDLSMSMMHCIQGGGDEVCGGSITWNNSAVSDDQCRQQEVSYEYEQLIGPIACDDHTTQWPLGFCNTTLTFDAGQYTITDLITHTTFENCVMQSTNDGSCSGDLVFFNKTYFNVSSFDRSCPANYIQISSVEQSYQSTDCGVDEWGTIIRDYNNTFYALSCEEPYIQTGSSSSYTIPLTQHCPADHSESQILNTSDCIWNVSSMLDRQQAVNAQGDIIFRRLSSFDTYEHCPEGYTQSRTWIARNWTTSECPANYTRTQRTQQGSSFEKVPRVDCPVNQIGHSVPGPLTGWVAECPAGTLFNESRITSSAIYSGYTCPQGTEFQSNIYGEKYNSTTTCLNRTVSTQGVGPFVTQKGQKCDSSQIQISTQQTTTLYLVNATIHNEAYSCVGQGEGFSCTITEYTCQQKQYTCQDIVEVECNHLEVQCYEDHVKCHDIETRCDRQKYRCEEREYQWCSLQHQCTQVECGMPVYDCFYDRLSCGEQRDNCCEQIDTCQLSSTSSTVTVQDALALGCENGWTNSSTPLTGTTGAVCTFDERTASKCRLDRPEKYTYTTHTCEIIAQSLAQNVTQHFVDEFINETQRRISLISYGSQSHLDVALTYNKSELMPVAQGYSSFTNQQEGQTCMSCALKHAVEQLRESDRPHANKGILLMTDGDANIYINQTSFTFNIPKAREEVIDYACNESNPLSAKANNIIVYTVAFGNLVEDTQTLVSIAECTNGQFFDWTDADSLYTVYENISKDLSLARPIPTIDVGDDGVLNFKMNQTLGVTTRWSNSCDPFVEHCDNLALSINNLLVSYNNNASMSGPYTINMSFNSSIPAHLSVSNLSLTMRNLSGPLIGRYGDLSAIPQFTCSVTPFKKDTTNGASDYCRPMNNTNTNTFAVIARGTMPFPSVNLNDYIFSFTHSKLSMTVSYHPNSPVSNGTIDNSLNYIVFPEIHTEGLHIINVSDPNGDETVLCLNLTRKEPGSLLSVLQPSSRLIISSSRSLGGIIEDPVDGSIASWGPYTATVQVWQRRTR